MDLRSLQQVNRDRVLEYVRRNFLGTCQKDSQGRIKVSTGEERFVVCITPAGATRRNSKNNWGIA